MLVNGYVSDLFGVIRWHDLGPDGQALDDHDDDHDHDHDHEYGLDALTIDFGSVTENLIALEANSLTDFAALQGTALGSAVADTLGAVQNFDFTITVVDMVGGVAQDVLDLFTDITDLAMGTWAQFLGGADGAVLDIQVNVGGTDAVASAGPFLFVDGILDVNGTGAFDTGDIVLAIAGSLLELQTGVDPNGAVPDIIVNVNEELLAGGAFFFDTTLEAAVPPGTFDFYSVILHELAHGLGFLGISDTSGNLPAQNFGDAENPIIAGIATLYDLLIVFDENGQPFFVGENAVAAYGAPVPLEFNVGPGSDISHALGTFNADGTPTDLALALMNPFVIPGDRVDIGDLELAILADIGHTIEQLTGRLVNEFDPLPPEFVPVASVQQDVEAEGGALVLTVTLDQIPPFLGIASSVAVEVSGPTGASATTRLQFLPGVQVVTFGVDIASFFGIELNETSPTEVAGDLTVTLFNPAQAALPNGEQFDTFTVSVDATVGTTGDDDINGGNGSQTILGNLGNDDLSGGNGNDFVDGGAGNDDVTGGNGNDTVLGGSGDDEVSGGNGNDFVNGGTGADDLSGGNGNDTVIGGAGDDTVTGGNGRDFIDGGADNDFISGGNGNDTLIGGSGDDTIFGGNGRDVIVSGSGMDILTGNNGNDIFDITQADQVTITDYNVRRDDIVIGETVIDGRSDFETFLDSEGVTFEISEDDLVISFGLGQTLIIEDGADLVS